MASTNQSTQESGNTAADPANLPQEALDLAGKLFDWARQGSTSQLREYVGAGIPPNLTNDKGDTLLMLAAYHGHADTVSMLLEKGADANALNDKGQSPIAGAVFKGYADVVKVLVDEGKADVQAGQPSAVDCARMFKREDLLSVMGVPNGATSTAD
jgi:uncharacterized protein